jgi:3-dehydroquinate synthase
MMDKSKTIERLIEHFRRKNIRKVMVLTDKNVDRCHGNYFDELSKYVAMDKLVLRPGEMTKTIRTAIQVWGYLAEKQYDKDTFLLNFGGGMVCDLGGFVASTFKRGIRYANCPTTLLAMIDAAIGGKTGVNLPSMKNGIGTFYFPDIQLPADVSLLRTLHREELLSGFGELVKYALIGSAELFEELCESDAFPEIKQEYIDFCINFKQDVVKKDPKDENLRHILNFGHTFGHALESYAAKTGKPIAHGIAVAQGLYYESLLSARCGYLPQEDWQLIANFLTNHFEIPEITPAFLEKLLPYMQNDKKNHDGHINFTLIDRIGHAIPNCQISTSQFPLTLNL